MYEKTNIIKNTNVDFFDFSVLRLAFHNDITLICAAILMAICIVISFAKKQ